MGKWDKRQKKKMPSSVSPLVFSLSFFNIFFCFPRTSFFHPLFWIIPHFSCAPMHLLTQRSSHSPIFLKKKNNKKHDKKNSIQPIEIAVAPGGAVLQPAGASVSPTRVSLGNVGVRYTPRGRDYSPVEHDMTRGRAGQDDDGGVAGL